MWGLRLPSQQGRRPDYHGGDADRLGLADEHGHFINQLRVFGSWLLSPGDTRPARTDCQDLSTTTMLNKLGKLYDVPVMTGVGFKYVAPKMLETDA